MVFFPVCELAIRALCFLCAVFQKWSGLEKGLECRLQKAS